MIKVKFYNKDGNWYADVPEHTEAENIMVGNTNKILDLIFWFLRGVHIPLPKDGKLELTLRESPDNPILHLHRYAHNGYGANYAVRNTKLKSYIKINVDDCWICNVTHTVCGEHPKDIYITEINGMTEQQIFEYIK